METNLALEILGYGASGLIVLSILQKSILRIRLVGLLGAIVFIVYSIGISAYPIMALNTVVAGIHLWFLRKLIRRKGEVFRILHVRPDSRYLLDFLDFYRDDIQGNFQPEFVYEPDGAQVTAFILRDMVPAGLFVGQMCDDGTFEVRLDFVIPQYRDFRIGRFVYAPDSELLAGLDPTAVWATASHREHARYLARMGFTECASIPGRFEIRLR